MDINEVRLNTHQQHFEDLVLFGEEGLSELNNYIEKFIAKDSDSINKTTKIDGAPAVICWSEFPGHADNSICLKSFVNGNKNDITSLEDLNKYDERPRMKEMLANCLELAKYIPAGQAWQGDCLFTKDTLKEREIEGKTLITFQPNKIIYAFDKGADYDRIMNADFGIAFHTIYYPAKDGIRQGFKVDATKINAPEKFYIMSPVIKSSIADEDGATQEIKRLYDKLLSLESKLTSDPAYEDLCKNEAFMKYWNTFENANLSDKKATNLDIYTFYGDLVQYVNDKMKKEYDTKVSKLKTDKGKAAAEEHYQTALLELQYTLEQNKKLLSTLVETLNCAADIKMEMWKALKDSELGYSTYYQKKTGEYEKGHSEGVAMSDQDGNIVKIVDRSQFSNINRSDEYTSGFDHNESLEEAALQDDAVKFANYLKDLGFLDKHITNVSFEEYAYDYGNGEFIIVDIYEDDSVEVWYISPEEKAKRKFFTSIKEAKDYMSDIEESLTESVNDTATLIWGRMNPITKGHMAMIEFAKTQGGDTFVYLSHKQDKDKNPLSYDRKIYWAQKAAGNVVKKSDATIIIQALQEIQAKGYNNLIYVCGSDRYEEMKELLNKYNGQQDKKGNIPFKFESIEVKQFGDERLTEEISLEQCSASLARKSAREDDFETFKQVVPFDESDAKELFKELKDSMGIHEMLEELTRLYEAESANKGTGEFEKKRSLNTANSLKDAYGLLRSELVKAGAKTDALAQFDKSVNDIETITNTLGTKDIKLLGQLGTRLNNAAAGLSATEFVKLFSPSKKDIEIIVDGVELKENNDVDSYGLSKTLVKDMIKCTKSAKNNTANIGPYEFLIAVLFKGGSFRLAGGGKAGDVSALYGSSQLNIEVKGVDDRAVFGFDIGASAEITSAFDGLMSKSVDDQGRTQKTRQTLWPESFPNYKFNKKEIPSILQNIPGVGKSGEISYHDLYMATFKHLANLYSKRFDLLALCRNHKIKIVRSENLVDYLVENGNVNFADHFGTRKFKIQPKKVSF